MCLVFLWLIKGRLQKKELCCCWLLYTKSTNNISKKTHTQHNKSLARSSCCRPASLCVQVHGAWITGQRDLVHNFFYCIPFMKLHVEMTWGYSKPFQNENFFFHSSCFFLHLLILIWQMEWFWVIICLCGGGWLVCCHWIKIESCLCVLYGFIIKGWWWWY